MKLTGRLHGWLPVTIALALVIAVAPFLWASSPGPGVTADQALTKLQEGNARFSGGAVSHPNCDPARRSLTASQGQTPFATILSCSDSRVPVELLGGTAFPPIGALPYLLTLKGYGYYGFRLASDVAAPFWHEDRVAGSDLPLLVLPPELPHPAKISVKISNAEIIIYLFLIYSPSF